MAGDATFSVEVLLNVKSNKGIMSQVNNTVKNTTKSVAQLNKESEKSLFFRGGLGIGQQVNELRGLAKQLENVEKTYGSTSVQANEFRGAILQQTGATSKELKQVSKQVKSLDFGFLSLIFAGIFLQRVFGGIFRNLREGYTKVADKNDVFIKKTNALSGAFQFLGFSIFKGFAQSETVGNVIDFLTRKLVDLGNFFDDHPQAGELLTSLAGGLALVGGALFLVGQGTTISMAIGAFFDKFGAGGISGATTNVNGFSSALQTLAGALAIDFALDLAEDFLQLPEPTTEAGKIGDWLAGILSGALILYGLKSVLVNPVGGILLITAGVGIRFIPEFVEFLGKKLFGLDTLEKSLKPVEGSVTDFLKNTQVNAGEVQLSFDEVSTSMESIGQQTLYSADQQVQFRDMKTDADSARESLRSLREEQQKLRDAYLNPSKRLPQSTFVTVGD